MSAVASLVSGWREFSSGYASTVFTALFYFSGCAGALEMASERKRKASVAERTAALAQTGQGLEKASLMALHLSRLLDLWACGRTRSLPVEAPCRFTNLSHLLPLVSNESEPINSRLREETGVG